MTKKKSSVGNVREGISLEKLNESLAEFVPREILKDGLLADLADIQDICLFYLSAVEEVAKRKQTPNEFEIFLRALDSELLDHLPFHIHSLRKLIPRVMRELNGKKNQSKSEGSE